MKNPVIILLVATVAAGMAAIANATPIGLCLHSYSSLAPADKIECFEFAKYEKLTDGYRFFLEPNGTTIVPNVRFRRVIFYDASLNPGGPAFDSTLALYVKTSTESPATRRFLNPRIQSMRALADARAKIRATEGSTSSNSSIKLKDGTILANCRATRIEGGIVVILHKEGITKVKALDLSAKDKETLQLAALEKRQQEYKKIEIAEAEKSEREAAARAAAADEFKALADAAGSPLTFIVQRRLNFKDFPALGWKIHNEAMGEELYEVTFAGGQPGLVITTGTSFGSGGRATLWLIEEQVVTATMDSGVSREVPVFVEADADDVKAFKKRRDELKTATRKK